MKTKQLTQAEFDSLRAQDLLATANNELGIATSAIDYVLASTAQRALEQGDKHTAEVFFRMASHA